MKAIVYQGAGDISVIQNIEVPSPSLKAGQVRIQVRASGINRADLVQRKGLYPPPPGESEIPGLEVAGEIVELSSEVVGFRVGDRVAALLAGGGYAEEVCVDAGLLLPLPSSFSFTDGAGLVEVFVTAHHNLFYLGAIGAGQAALVHAGASGVGTAAIQLLREAGVRAFVTVGSAEKAAFCEKLGAEAIPYKTESFADVILKKTEERGVDAILDPVAASYFEANLRCLGVGGRLVFIGTMGGREVKLDLGLLMKKRHRLIGSTLRALPLEEKRAAVDRFRSQFGEALYQGKIHPIIDTVFTALQVKDAHNRMESNLNIGKIIFTW